MVGKTRKNMYGGKQTHPDLVEGQRYKFWLKNDNSHTIVFIGTYKNSINMDLPGLGNQYIFSNVNHMTIEEFRDEYVIPEKYLYDNYMWELVPTEGGRRRKHRKGTRKASRKASRKANMRRRK